ncbi:hypothetical protein AB0M23_25425 [Streptomyces sp. NPDC052077]|uniref:hypothetical protein n=1 Tax=Streptomyces sp. NPDC052077 TaxID=3154757 RepID=UPI0034261970
MDAERPHPESVSVELSGCTEEDARAVFDALCARFPSDRHTGDETRRYDAVRPTVWLGTFDVAAGRAGEGGPAPLGASVEADAQGGYWAVERLRVTLDSLFTVRDLSTASGDQEREMHVRLESR